VENANAKLWQLNPRLVLARGYAIVLTDGGKVVRSAAAAPAGSDVKLLFAEDSLKARVTESPAE
jgi:exonuclease VII large subunit